jgi:hypothetical protein
MTRREWIAGQPDYAWTAWEWATAAMLLIAWSLVGCLLILAICLMW